MKNKMKKLLLAGLLILTPQLALAEGDGTNTGMEFLEACKAVEKDDPDGLDRYFSGFCLGVIGSWMFLEMFNDFSNFICLPGEVTVEQGRLVFLRYAEKHPEWLHMEFHVLIEFSFAEAWPC